MSLKQKEIDKGWQKILKEHKLKEVYIKTGLFGEGSVKDNMAHLGLVQHEGANIKITPKMRGFLRSISIFVKDSTVYIVIPKRPFMSNAFDKYLNEIISFIMREYGAVVDGKITFNQALKRMGIKHIAQIKKGFTDFTYAPNHPITAAKKGSSKPLINTGRMRNAVTFKVVKRK